MSGENRAERVEPAVAHVDCDVHPGMDREEVASYLPKNYREQQGYFVPQGMWSNPETGFLDEPVAVDAQASDATLEEIESDVLDGAEWAVLNPDSALLISTSPQVHYAPVLARAYNDWLVENWLDETENLVGSMVIAPQHPSKAAEEIERIGDHPKVKQVIMGSASGLPYGKPTYWPIYEAAEKQGLPVAIHPGPAGHGLTGSPTGAGYPQTFFEKHSAEPDHLMGQLASLLGDGVFVEYPDLDFVFLEAGFTWLPSFTWRANKDWKSLRAEVPYLEDPPSSYIERNCWFSTHPLPSLVEQTHLEQLIEMLPAEDVLMYGSGYPYTAEGTQKDLTTLEESVSQRILYENATELYGLSD